VERHRAHRHLNNLARCVRMLLCKMAWFAERAIISAEDTCVSREPSRFLFANACFRAVARCFSESDFR